MILTETAPPPALPVALADFKAHLRLSEGFPEDGAEDALLTLYLEQATAQVESALDLALVSRGFRLTTARWGRGEILVLPVGPVPAIDALVFSAEGRAPVAVDGTRLMLEPARSRQRLTGAGGSGLPPIPVGHVAELTFSAGFGAEPAAVPPDLAQAVMLLAAHRYENRTASEEPTRRLPGGVEALVAPFRPARL